MKRLSLLFAVAAVTGALLIPAAAQSSPAQATRLVATVGPGFNITLTRAGTKVKRLKPGRYVIRVRDRSNIHNFHLKGPGVNRDSGVAFVGTKTYRVRLKRGSYLYVCDPHASSMRDTFRVR